jgi:hypothetical protein
VLAAVSLFILYFFYLRCDGRTGDAGLFVPLLPLPYFVSLDSRKTREMAVAVVGN